MITGVHALMYSPEADAIRAFFRDVLEFRGVDAGHGWLIFVLPPAELAIHPTDDEPYTEMYLMCDDLDATIAMLQAKGVELARPVADQPWGRATSLRLPDGGALGLYQPRHPTALGG